MTERSGEHGLALVAALWVSVLLALAAGAVLHLSRAELHRAATLAETARMEAIGDAALNLGLAWLTGPAAAQPPLDGTGLPVTIDGQEIVLRIVDENGKINLNLANGRVLGLLLSAIGLDPDAATRLTERILAWRDPAAPSAGRGGPFRSVGELRQVGGVDEAIFRRLEPALTVWSQTDWIDPAFAGPTVMEVLRGITPGTVATGTRMLATPGHAYTLHAHIAGHRTRVAVVRLTGQAARPFLVYRWD